MKLILFFLSFSALSFQLKFKEHFEIPHNFKFKNTIVGGLSGIKYSHEKKKFFLISDDRSNKSNARIYVFKIDLSNEKTAIKIDNVIILKQRDGSPFIKGSIDFEDIEILENGHFLITSEAIIKAKKIHPPRIIEFDNRGYFLRDIKIDSKYYPRKSNGYFNFGQRDNKGFESLTLNKNQDHLFTITEQALYQDGDIATHKQPGLLRFLTYSKNRGLFSPHSEYIYEHGPLRKEKLNYLQSLSPKSGVTTILPYKDDFLFLERVFYPFSYRTYTYLYKVSLPHDISNIIGEKSLIKSKETIKLNKKLITELSSIIGKRLRKVDNLEGMTWGPELKNGNKTLIFVSDNNFQAMQTTQLLIFEVVE